MSHSIDTIRLSEKQKQQLARSKAKTGIDNWNVLCRWALCLSLGEDTPPAYEDIPTDSNVEMSWKVFAGEYAEVYLAVLRQSYQKRSPQLEAVSFAEFFKLHLNRGISFYSKTA